MKNRGFTLIELVVTLAIVGILSVVAIKIYTSRVRQGRRVDGINALLMIALAEERYRANNATYGSLAQANNSVASSPEGFYTLSITGNSATAYTATATAVGNQSQDSANGTSCSTLTLAVSNGTVTKSPAACWPT